MVGVKWTIKGFLVWGRMVDDGTQSVCGGLVREETERLVRDMASQDITVTRDETFTGGLCLVAIEPISNYTLIGATG